MTWRARILFAAIYVVSARRSAIQGVYIGSEDL